MSTKPQEDTSLFGSMTYQRIDFLNYSTDEACSYDKETNKKNHKSDLTVTNLLFVQTTHVVGSESNFIGSRVHGYGRPNVPRSFKFESMFLASQE